MIPRWSCLLLVSTLGASAAPAETNVAPPDAFVLRRFELVPPFRNFHVRPVAFPEKNPMAGIHALAAGGDRVWISAGPWADTNLPAGRGRLWTFRPADNVIEPIRGSLEDNAVGAMTVRGTTLWMTLEGGIGALDLNTYQVAPYAAAQGITSPTPAGVAAGDRGVFVMGAEGALFRRAAAAGPFVRLDGPAPGGDLRNPAPWTRFALSGDWAMATGAGAYAFRHQDAPSWTVRPEGLKPLAPDLAPASVTAVIGEAEGRFWIGSDAGLWMVQGDNGATEIRERASAVTVPGGYGVRIGPGLRATAATAEAARRRVMDGVRERMRLRARYLRASRDAGRPVDPVTPRSRIPGPVTALASDRGFLWIATGDPVFPTRSRVLLLHPASRKWVGWFPVGFPVLALAADTRFLWLGCDARSAPGATPLLAAEKAPLLSLPVGRWTPDEIDAPDIAARVAALPPRERAVYAFFSGDHSQAVELGSREDATDEMLFLRAVANDAAGLDSAPGLAEAVERLRERFPSSLFAELAGGLVPRRQPAAAPTSPAGTEEDDVSATMGRRDLDSDGRLNIVELRLWLGPQADPARWDKDGDRQIDRAELPAVLADNPGR